MKQVVAKDNHSQKLNRIGRLKNKKEYLIGRFTDAVITHFHIIISTIVRSMFFNHMIFSLISSWEMSIFKNTLHSFSIDSKIQIGLYIA